MEPRIVVDVLVELARREHELTESAAVADRGLREARDRRELLDELAHDARLASGAVDAAEIEFRRRDRELRELEARLAERRSRLVGISDRRQHRALGEEIAALEQRIDQLEDAAIAQLDETAQRRAEAASVRRDEARLARRDLEAHADLVAGVERAEAAVTEVQAEIDRLVGMLPPDVARHVTRLRRRDGHAVAWVENGACTGCFARLPHQEAIAVERGRRVLKCSSCARFVVCKPWR